MENVVLLVAAVILTGARDVETIVGLAVVVVVPFVVVVLAAFLLHSTFWV